MTDVRDDLAEEVQATLKELADSVHADPPPFDPNRVMAVHLSGDDVDRSKRGRVLFAASFVGIVIIAAALVAGTTRNEAGQGVVSDTPPTTSEPVTQSGPPVTAHPDEPAVPPVPDSTTYYPEGEPFGCCSIKTASDLVSAGQVIVTGQASSPRRVGKSTLSGDRYTAFWAQTVTVDRVLRGDPNISSVEIILRGPDTVQPGVVRLLEAGNVDLPELGLSVPAGQDGVFFLRASSGTFLSADDLIWSETIDPTTAYVLADDSVGFVEIDGDATSDDSALKPGSFPHIPVDFPGLTLTPSVRERLKTQANGPHGADLPLADSDLRELVALISSVGYTPFGEG